MEKDIKQHSITYNKGITNQPSYIIADDGELSDCVGLTFENGELKPIQKAVSASGNVPNEEILAVHGGRYLYQNGQYIEYNSGSGVLHFNGTFQDIAIIGNTVVVSTSEELHYALWNGEEYDDLGTTIPEPDVELRMGELASRRDLVNFHDLVEDDQVLSEKQQECNDVVWGTIRRMVSSANEKTLFVFPFVARVALELYDGSYLLHSAPHIMLPWYGGDYFMFKNHDMGSKGYIYIPTADLRYKVNNSNYSKWSDIVKNITLFISRPHTPFLENVVFENMGPDYDRLPVECGYMLRDTPSSTGSVVKDLGDGHGYFYNGVLSDWGEVRLILHQKNAAGMLGELKEEGNFFKLCDLGLEQTLGGVFKTTQGMFGSTTIASIEAQQQLTNEDFHTHDCFVNGKLYSFNGRLHIRGAQRKLFGGFSSFFEWTTSSYYSYKVVVTIKTKDGEKQAYLNYGSTKEAIGSFYFYYPDNRATEAKIYVGNSYWKTLTLTEHPGLNGAFWIKNTFPTSQYAPNPQGTGSSPGTIDSVENLQDTLIVSEVDNPFLFLSKGYVRVGQTPIIGIAAITMALSEYQHGNLPLAAFTEDGIWSLSISSDGYYKALQAISREVCNNPKSITQVDNGIFFASEKGLMYLDTSGVKCVSAQLRGTVFDDVVDDCIIAYDYRDSLLHIYCKNDTYEDTYVYNMKTGTFSELQGEYQNVVNNYPDTLIQYHYQGTWHTHSLLQKPDERKDNTTYTGYIRTRPMKFGNILTLKSIRQLRHLYAMNTNATVELTIKASNDGVNWATLDSLRGKPWKLYRFEITMTGLKATDRYAGTVVWTQERRTEKLR